MPAAHEVLPVLSYGSGLSVYQPEYVLRRLSVYFQYHNDSVNKNPAPVGAAIGRPPVKICSNVKQNASAEKISTTSPAGRL